MLEPVVILRELLTSQIPVAVFAWRNEPGWPLEYASPGVERVVGHDARSFYAGLDYSSIIHPDDLARVFDEVARFSEAGVASFEHEDYRIQTKSGQTRWVKDYTTVVRDDQGTITHYYGYILDISERVAALASSQAEIEARIRSDELKDRFFAGISHDLRSPLSAMIGYADLLLESCDDDEIDRDQLRSDAASIRACGDHLIELVNDILDLAKLRAGHSKIRPEPVEIDALIARLSASAAPLVRNRENQWSVEIAPEAPSSIWTDALKLRQIMINLISNAAKFTTRGSIGLEIEPAELSDRAALRLTVRDSGVGISPSRLEAIFEAFIQAERDTELAFGGTGIGLALSRELAELLGGELTVESTLGHGSAFALTLPLA